MNKRIALLPLGALSLSACAAGLPGLRPTTYAMPGEAHVYATGHRCPHEPVEVGATEGAPLIFAALTGIASQLLKNFGTALSEGTKGGALTPSTAMTNLELEPGATPRCILVIRGAFQPTDKASATLDLAAVLGVAPETDGMVRLTSLNVEPVYAVNHVIELRVDPSANGKALTIAPVWVLMNQSIDGARKGERDVSIAVQFARVGSNDKYGSTIVLQDRQLGAAASRFERRKATGRWPAEAPWFATFHNVASNDAAVGGAKTALPPPPQGSNPAATPPLPPVIGGGGPGVGGPAIARPPVASPGGTIPSMNSGSPTAIPVTLTATVVETRPTKEGLAFIAGIYGGLQPKLEEQAKLLLDPNFAQQAAATAGSAELTLASNLATASAAARAATITYCETSSKADDAAGKLDRITKSKTVFEAQVKANDAALKAFVDPPFDSVATISEKLPGIANSGLCASVS